MTFRGVYRDGVIILEDATGLRNGTVVEVIRPGRTTKPPAKKLRKVPKPRATSKPKASRRRASTQEENPLLELIGIWKDRPDWKGKSTLEIQQELRRKAMGGRSDGSGRRG